MRVLIVSTVLCVFLILTALADILSVKPSEIVDLVEDTSVDVELVFTNCTDSSLRRNFSLSISEGTERTVSFPRDVYNVPCQTFDSNGTASPGHSVQLTGKVVGFAKISIKEKVSSEELAEYSVGVIREVGQLKDKIFLYGIIIMSIFNTLCFGIQLNLEKVKLYLKKPIAPGIGVVCQFLLMPLIAFTLTRIIDKNEALDLGIFAVGCAPGGGGSNIWAYALGGDVDLSITMTFISTLAAIAFVPLWMYTLGSYIIGDDSLVLPFVNMATTLAVVVIPVGIGLLVNRFLPKIGKGILKAQKWVIGITIAYAIGMGIYANIYAFKVVLFDYQLAICGFMLPWAGGFLSFLIGLLFKQKKPVALTIGIETSVQNTSVATILLRTSLPQPWADISTAVPITLNLFTPIPFYFIFIGRRIYLARKAKQKAEAEQSAENAIEGEKESSPTSDDKFPDSQSNTDAGEGSSSASEDSKSSTASANEKRSSTAGYTNPRVEEKLTEEMKSSEKPASNFDQTNEKKPDKTTEL